MIELTASRDVPPKISSAAVLSGTKAVSSGSDVVDDEADVPTELSTPTTGEREPVHIDGLAHRILAAEELQRPSPNPGPPRPRGR